MSEIPTIRYRLRVKEGRERSLALHHPWLFSGAIEEVEALDGAEPGDLGDVVDSAGQFLARGTVHPESQILCRVLSWRDEPIDRDFFRRRVERALALRSTLFEAKTTNAYRAVNAEGDELPGLIVDRYHDVLAVQTLTVGMRRLRPLWLDALEELLAPRAIVERGPGAAQESLGSDDGDGTVLRGTLASPELSILEHGLSFSFDVAGGQKTGFYLDQRENRALAGQLAAGRRVLDLFGYTGGFAIHAGRGGAREVVAVESSGPARQLALRNWKQNGLSESIYESASGDAFEYLRKHDGKFDLLVLDPPPLARDRSSVERALRAYKDLLLWAFVRATPGAHILAFSCSQHVSADLFQKVVFGAARDAGAEAQTLGRLGAGADHPVHLDHPQGEYLKGLWLRALVPGEAPGPGGRPRPPRPAAKPVPKRPAARPEPRRREPTARETSRPREPMRAEESRPPTPRPPRPKPQDRPRTEDRPRIWRDPDLYDEGEDRRGPRRERGGPTPRPRSRDPLEGGREEDRPRRPRPGSRPIGGRPSGPRPQGSRPAGGARPGSSRPGGARPGGSRPGGSRPSGGRPGGSRPGSPRPTGSRPGGSRPGGAPPGGRRGGGTRPRGSGSDSDRARPPRPGGRPRPGGSGRDTGRPRRKERDR